MTSKFQLIMKDKKAIVFDFDGTLIDSLDAWGAADNQFFQKRNLQFDQHTYLNAITGLNLQQSAEYIIAKYNLQETPEQVIAEWSASYDEIFSKVSFYPKALEFLHFLKDSGIPFGIATAGPRKVFDIIFREHQDLKQHVTYVSCNDVHASKPDPAVYFECMKRMGVTPQDCVVFEDTVSGLTGAANTGSTVVCALTDQQKRQEKLQLSHHYFETYSELI
ncbi:Beta-phosphoglucomutase [Hexamita inflata]|uniref:Beta-phosphoglucomutase n=1 Tax=Hexamita inflata TaxID=28002 RepID=A0AA86U4I6_9EUKA|nr:Beta-phosphoglucomutase [Hexamita inflata]